MYVQDLLVVEYPTFKKKLDGFFSRMADSKDLQLTFINNPVGVLTFGIFDDKFIPEEKSNSVSDANRLLYSILSNEEFYDWIKSYNSQINEEMASKGLTRPDFDKVAKDVATAISKFGDKEIIMSLTRYSDKVPNKPKGGGATPSQPKPPTNGGTWVTDFVVVVTGVAVLAYVVAIVVGFVGLAVVPGGDPVIPEGITPAQLEALSQRLIAKAKLEREQGRLFDPAADFS